MGGLALGAHPEAFRLVYAAGAVVACVGVGVFMKLRILEPGEYIVTLHVEGPAGKDRRTKVWDVTLP